MKKNQNKNDNLSYLELTKNALQNFEVNSTQ